jgi:hypothetical protein
LSSLVIWGSKMSFWFVFFCWSNFWISFVTKMNFYRQDLGVESLLLLSVYYFYNRWNILKIDGENVLPPRKFFLKSYPLAPFANPV